MSKLKEVRSAFEALGYSKLAGVRVTNRGDVWYRHRASRPDAVHVLYLEYKPSSKAYGVWIGAYNPEAIEMAQAVFPLIQERLGYQATNYLVIRQWPCWTMFYVGRALATWQRRFEIPDPLNREAWPLQFDELKVAILEPTFRRMEGPKDVLEMLMKNEIPYEWRLGGNSIMRVAEVIALARIIGLPSGTILARLIEFQPILSQQLSRIRGLSSSDAASPIHTLDDRIYD